MDQERSLRIDQEITRVATPSVQYPPTQGLLPTPPTQMQPHFTCELPTNTAVSTTQPRAHAFFFLTRGKVQMDIQNAESASTFVKTDERRPRTVTFKGPYDVLLSPTSQVEELVNNPRHLVGYQEDLQLRKQQRQQQRAESKALRAPEDLRDKIAALKSARDPTGVISSIELPNPPPTARKGRFLGEVQAEEQLDITVRDAARLQREGRATVQESTSSTQRFDRATSKGDSETVRTLHKATVGMHYLRPVKKSSSLAD